MVSPRTPEELRSGGLPATMQRTARGPQCWLLAAPLGGPYSVAVRLEVTSVPPWRREVEGGPRYPPQITKTLRPHTGGPHGYDNMRSQYILYKLVRMLQLIPRTEGNVITTRFATTF